MDSCSRRRAGRVPTTWPTASRGAAPAIRVRRPLSPTTNSNQLPIAATRHRRPLPQVTRSRRSPSRVRRATELLRQAMASEDADEFGLRAEHVLADCRTALALLGGADASPAARAAVIQRFGRVGALLVLGYEERGRARDLGPDGSVPGDRNASHDGHRNPSHNGRHNASHHSHPDPSHNGHPTWPGGPRGAEQFNDGKRHFERLVRDFADLDAVGSVPAPVRDRPRRGARGGRGRG